MYSTPSKLRHSSNDPPTHLIITQATSSSEDEQTPFPPHLGSSPVLNDALTDEDDEKYGSMRIPVLNLGASASEAHSETQNLVVNAFHKVLSVLRQYVNIAHT